MMSALEETQISPQDIAVRNKPVVCIKRLSAIKEAKSFLGTPYHHQGRLKGVGADCLTLLAEVYEKAGVIPHIEIPFYPPDFFAHRDIEQYIEGLIGYAREIDGPPQPGDIVLFKFGRCFSHGAIVVDWPLIIHAWARDGVRAGDATQERFKGRETKFFCPFPN